MAYIGNSPGVASQRIVSKFTATASQTTFTPTSGYTVGYLDVYLNGVKLINGDDYTASNGSTFVLASGAASGDIVESVAYLPRGLSDGYTKAEADARYMDINEDTLPSQTGNSGKYLTTDGSTASWDTITAPTPAAVSDAANISTGYFALPTGTTAQRPGSAAAGYTRMNTTTGSVEFYNGTDWVSTNLIPSISSISGTIYAGAASTLTLSLINATDTVNVAYYEGGTLLATDNVVTVTSGSATSTVPSAVYGQTAGDTISVSVFNSDGTPSSNSITKTVTALPAGGTITTSGSYRIHTFTSSGTFTVPSGFSAASDVLIVAGGGGTGYDVGGGGGAGGLLSQSPTLSSGSYSITIGGGGGSGQSGSAQGSDGGNTTAFGFTAIGGGGGGAYPSNINGRSGGSGGGAGTNNGSGGSGTSGQGYAGGTSAGSYWGSGAGGGAGGAGSNGVTNTQVAGGAPVYSSISGTNTAYAGGGYGNSDGGTIRSTGTNASGTSVGFYGFGANGTGAPNGSPYSGNSGVVIIRYQV
jgi:hypothetical protein